MSTEISPLRRQAHASTDFETGTQELRRSWRSKMSAAAPSGSAKLAATVEQAREAMPTAGRDVRGRREATFRCGSAEHVAWTL